MNEFKKYLTEAEQKKLSLAEQQRYLVWYNGKTKEAKAKDRLFTKLLMVFGFGAIAFYALLVSRDSFTFSGKLLAIVLAFAWSFTGNAFMDKKRVSTGWSKGVLWGAAILFAVLLIFVEPGK